eukprot:4087178-Pyramimonas_sp.AAC.1
MCIRDRLSWGSTGGDLYSRPRASHKAQRSEGGVLQYGKVLEFGFAALNQARARHGHLGERSALGSGSGGPRCWAPSGQR